MNQRAAMLRGNAICKPCLLEVHVFCPPALLLHYFTPTPAVGTMHTTWHGQACTGPVFDHYKSSLPCQRQHCFEDFPSIQPLVLPSGRSMAFRTVSHRYKLEDCYPRMSVEAAGASCSLGSLPGRYSHPRPQLLTWDRHIRQQDTSRSPCW